MKIFKVNGKEYTTKAFDYNLICDLEDMGIALQEAANKPMSLVRAYFSLCSDKGKEFAGKELEAHLIKGGEFDDIMNAMSEEMDKSDFFLTLSQKEEATASETQKGTKKATK